MVPTPPEGELGPLVVGGTFCTGIPPGVTPGIPLDHVMAGEFVGLPLNPGRYQWQFTMDEQANEDWALGFTVVVQPPQALAA